MVLICFSLMPNDAEHISHVYNLNGEIQVFGLFLNYSSFESSLYILNTSSLSISHWQVLFSPVRSLSFFSSVLESKSL